MIKSSAIALLSLLLAACAPTENCCAERNELAETLRLQSAQLDAAERDAEHSRRMLEQLQSSLLEEKTKNKTTPTSP